MNRMLKSLMWSVYFSIALFGCGDNKTSPHAYSKTIDLPTQVVNNTAILSEEVVDGALEAINQATVSAQTAGRVITLPFDVGARVKPGDVVVRFRDTELRAKLNQAEANLKAAMAQMLEADKTFRRTQDVFQKKLIAAVQMDKAVADHDAARSQLEAAQAARDQAVEQMDYSQVRAPYAGIITERQVQVGEAVMPGQPLLTIQGGEEVRAVVDVSQQLADVVRRNAKTRIIFADGSHVAGTQVTVFPNADPSTHTFRVRVEMPKDASASHHAGQLIKVAFGIGESTGTALPAFELVWRGEVAGVYVIDDGRLEFRAVRPGRTRADGMIEILSGLHTGDKVVKDPSKATEMMDR